MKRCNADLAVFVVMRWGRPKWVIRQIFHLFFLTILIILIVTTVYAIVLFHFSFDHETKKETEKTKPIQIVKIEAAPTRYLNSSSIDLTSRLDYMKNCNTFDCFDIHRCGKSGFGKLSVYVYPFQNYAIDHKFLNLNVSKEYYQVIDTILNSSFYVPDPSKACIFVPTIDLLNYSHKNLPIEKLHLLLMSLEFWENHGSNHLLINLSGDRSLFRMQHNAMVASPSVPNRSFDFGFHLSIIQFNSRRNTEVTSPHSIANRNLLALSIQREKFEDIGFLEDSILLLGECDDKKYRFNYRCKGSEKFRYPDVIKGAEFCIIWGTLTNTFLWDSMSLNCIPVIVASAHRLPFSYILDWKKFSITISRQNIEKLSFILKSISLNHKKYLKRQVHHIFSQYFESIPKLTLTLLKSLEDQFFRHKALSWRTWNKDNRNVISRSNLFTVDVSSKTPGYTAVILAYDRIASLSIIVERISASPSLTKILIIWNNDKKDPPALSTLPKVEKKIEILRTKENKISNRFLPFHEIETEAVFSLDDDILMLNPDEIEFAFDTWREFPDRIVGFPSRTHVWDNVTNRWKYDSEWTNKISMVLTGAAFYHKYWHYEFSSFMNKEIKDWVDSKMNCEDIALNFLVAQRTGKPPIKVAPRKKFKCPSCNKNQMLSTDTVHMVERTDCINKFAQIYGHMPLMNVEFRADPVLYKVSGLPTKLLKYKEIGRL